MLHALPVADIGFFLHQYFDFQVMRDNFDFVLQGFWMTIRLSLLSAALSLMWGLILSVMRQTRSRASAPIRFFAIAYIDIFRGIPLLLVLLMINGGFPQIADSIGLPQSVAVPQWFGLPDPFWYGTMALTITYGAYMAEVYRAGIEAVPSGQMEAARSLGMSHGEAMRQVIVPQAIRKVIPPLLNDFIALTKDTSLVGVIALIEVVEAGRTVQADTFNSSAYTLGAVLFIITTVPLARLVDRLIAGQQARVSRSS